MSLPIPGALFVATVLASRSITRIAFWNRRCWQECKFWGLDSNSPRLIKLHMSKVFAKSFQQMQDSCQTDWNFWQDKINFCRTGGLSVIKLLSLFARNHRPFVRQTEIFCRTDWKFASFVRQSCSFHKDCMGIQPVCSLKCNQVFIPIISESRESSGWHWRRELKKKQNGN